MAGGVGAQSTDKAVGDFDRKNTWTVFAEYSNTSSHLLMGIARQRELADMGFAYTRRVVGFMGSTLSYQVELRPVLFESDPVTFYYNSFVQGTGPGPVIYTSTLTSVNTTACIAGQTFIFVEPPFMTYPGYTETSTVGCGRQWTFGQSFSPVGFKYSMGTRHRLQPFVVGTLGYMYTNRPVPVADAGSFNFAFDFGPGLELFRSGTRSVALECRYHHFSNKNSAMDNPGTDNVMYKVSYSFGR
jgi:hypothetical protein